MERSASESERASAASVRRAIHSAFVDRTSYYGPSAASKRARTHVSLPFAEPITPGVSELRLSDDFLLNSRWKVLVDEYFVGRFRVCEESGRSRHSFAQFHRYCEWARPHDDHDYTKEHVPISDSVSLVERIDRGRDTPSRIYVALIRQDDGTVIRCVAKVMPLLSLAGYDGRSSQDDAHAWDSSRKRDGTRMRCESSWMETIAMSKVYPSRFYGNATFFDPRARSWFTVMFMPFYRGTLWGFVSKALASYDRVTGQPCPASNVALPQELLAAVAQVVLHTIPKAKKDFLVAHNDLKTDNLAWRPTRRKHVYVRLVGDEGDEGVTSTLLAIPTLGKLFYLLDFGWASLKCPLEGVEVASCTPALVLDSPMKVWNACTDIAQAAYSVWHQLATHFRRHQEDLYSVDSGWWSLLDVLENLMAVDDSGGIIRMSQHNWQHAFYAGISTRCHFPAWCAFIDLMKERYACNAERLPRGRKAVAYEPRRVLVPDCTR